MFLSHDKIEEKKFSSRCSLEPNNVDDLWLVIDSLRKKILNRIESEHNKGRKNLNSLHLNKSKLSRNLTIDLDYNPSLVKDKLCLKFLNSQRIPLGSFNFHQFISLIHSKFHALVFLLKTFYFILFIMLWGQITHFFDPSELSFFLLSLLTRLKHSKTHKYQFSARHEFIKYTSLIIPEEKNATKGPTMSLFSRLISLCCQMLRCSAMMFKAARANKQQQKKTSKLMLHIHNCETSFGGTNFYIIFFCSSRLRHWMILSH